MTDAPLTRSIDPTHFVSHVRFSLLPCIRDMPNSEAEFLFDTGVDHLMERSVAGRGRLALLQPYPSI